METPKIRAKPLSSLPLLPLTLSPGSFPGLHGFPLSIFLFGSYSDPKTPRGRQYFTGDF